MSFIIIIIHFNMSIIYIYIYFFSLNLQSRFYFSLHFYYFSNYLELTQFDLILFIYSFWLPIITLVNKRKLIFLKSLTV